MVHINCSYQLLESAKGMEHSRALPKRTETRAWKYIFYTTCTKEGKKSAHNQLVKKKLRSLPQQQPQLWLNTDAQRLALQKNDY